LGTELQTVITRNIFFARIPSLLNDLIGYVRLVDYHETGPEHSLSIEEQKHVGNFCHRYFSCDRRERSRVGKLFDAITLPVYKKITYKNTRTPRHSLRD